MNYINLALQIQKATLPKVCEACGEAKALSAFEYERYDYDANSVYLDSQDECLECLISNMEGRVE
jgi:hypothetical protein